jgi:quinoprotein glucose dehydrogenase
VRWHFQTTHHDLWDYDVGSPPTLIDLPGADGVVPALIQPTKRGDIFVLNRLTGEPLTEVTEQPAPQNAADGDWVSATQPFSTGMPRFAGAATSEKATWGITALDQLWCRIQYKRARDEGTMTPPGLEPTFGSPGFLGGMDWGGISVDPERLLMVVNWNHIANYNHLITRAEADRRGIKPTAPGGANAEAGPAAMAGTPFGVVVSSFMSPLKVPCQAPPWGSVSVVDLKSRKTLWTRPLGTARDSGPLGIPTLLPIPIGLPNIGGSLTTRSGLVFIGAAQERTFRAFDIQTGRVLWEARLPAGGQATPMTYLSSKGRQFVVIAAGGHEALSTKPGDAIVAYTLPE